MINISCTRILYTEVIRHACLDQHQGSPTGVTLLACRWGPVDLHFYSNLLWVWCDWYVRAPPGQTMKIRCTRTGAVLVVTSDSHAITWWNYFVYYSRIYLSGFLPSTACCCVIWYSEMIRSYWGPKEGADATAYDEVFLKHRASLDEKLSRCPDLHHNQQWCYTICLMGAGSKLLFVLVYFRYELFFCREFFFCFTHHTSIYIYIYMYMQTQQCSGVSLQYGISLFSSLWACARRANRGVCVFFCVFSSPD